jgi:heptose I phosphotransferase
VAEMARKFHQNGMNHQDFYLSHMFLGQDETLYLIDLQRVVRRRRTPRRYLIKDLGQLNYAADFVGTLSRTDRMRFLLEYLEKPTLSSHDKSMVRKILAKTDRIAKHTVKLLERRRRRGELPATNPM